MRTWLLAVWIVGCGSPTSPLTGGDAADDVASPSAMTTATVQDPTGQPVAGVDVYFLAADSTLLAIVPTDSLGQASAQLSAGGSISVERDHFGSQVYTYANLAPGEAVWFGLQLPRVGYEYRPYTMVRDMSFTMSYANLRPQDNWIHNTSSVWSGDWLHPFNSSASMEATPTGTTVVASYPMPSTETLVVETMFQNGFIVGDRLLDWFPAAATYNVDVSAELLHPITPPSRTGDAFAWQEEPIGVAANYVYVDLTTWHVLAHHSGETTFTLPALPPQLQRNGTLRTFALLWASFPMLPQFFRSEFDRYDIPANQPSGRVIFQVYAP